MFNIDAHRAARGVVRSGAFDLGYQIEGQGEPVLVVGSAIYYPRTFSQALREKLRFVFLDHRGFAKPSRPACTGDFGLDRVVDDVELVRSLLGLGKITILGHSGHGYMALEYARRYPQHIGKVVVVGTGPSHAARHMQAAEERWRAEADDDRKQVFEEDMAKLPLDLAAHPEKRFIAYCIRMSARSWFNPRFDATSLWRGVHVNMAAFDHLWGETFRDLDMAALARQVEAPVLLALGRFDYLVAPAENWEEYRDDFRALTLRIFDKSGHTPQLEQAAEFDAAMLEFLAEG